MDFTLKTRIAEAPPLLPIPFVKIPKIVMRDTSDPQLISTLIQGHFSLVPW